MFKTKTRKLVTLVTVAAMAMGVSACGAQNDSVTKKETKAQEQIQKRLNAKLGYPKVDNSLELLNLKRRYELLDDENKTGYVSLLNEAGAVVAQYTIKGKVSSLESQYSNPIRTVDCGTDCAVTIDQAEPDGSYGKNPPGIFFFTAQGTYVEWSGTYLYADAPTQITAPDQKVLLKTTK